MEDYSYTSTSSPSPESGPSLRSNSQGSQQSMPALVTDILHKGSGIGQEEPVKERQFTAEPDNPRFSALFKENVTSNEIVGCAEAFSVCHLTEPVPKLVARFSHAEFSQLAECASKEETPSLFGDEPDEPGSSIELDDAQNTYAKLQIKGHFSYPSAAKLLENIAAIPAIYRLQVREVALALIVNELGHEWGLEGEVDIGNESIDLEGADHAYMQTRAAMRLSEFFRVIPSGQETASLSQNDKSRLLHAMKKGVEYVLKDKTKEERVEMLLQDFHDNKCVVIPTGWHNHSVQVVLYQDGAGNNFLAYVNRGMGSREESLFAESSDIEIYKIPASVGEEELKEVLKDILVDEKADSKEQKSMRMEFFEGRKSQGLHDRLQLAEVSSIGKKEQKVGNCSWANTKAGVHAAMVLMQMDKTLAQEGRSQRGVNSGVADNAIKMTEKEVRSVYKSWTSASRASELRTFLALQKRIQQGELHVASRDAKTLFKQEDLFNVMQQIGTKLAGSGRFRSNDPIFQQLESELTDFLTTLDLPLRECVNNDAFDRESLHTILEQCPGAFMVYMGPSEAICLAFLGPDGQVVEEVYNGNEKLNDVMRSRGLKYPITVTDELLNRAEIQQKVNKAKDDGIYYEDEKAAKEALLGQKTGSFVYIPDDSLGKYVRVILLPGQKFGFETGCSSLSESVLQRSDEVTLKMTGRYLLYKPSLAVQSGKLNSQKEYTQFMQKVTDKLNEDGDYVCVRTTTVSENHDWESDSVPEYTTLFRIFLKREDQVVEYPLDPEKPLFEQIERYCLH